MKKAAILILLVLVVWVLWGNTAVEVNEWVIESPEIPASFDGYRIAQISDLHNAELPRLSELLRDSKPDIIVLTGDLIDSRNTDVAAALKFAADAVKIAPCYYVTGNHESRVAEYAALRRGLLDLGVTVLEDGVVTLERAGASVTLAGVRDPAFGGDFETNLRRLMTGEGYMILLSHRPERMSLYAESGADLVFSGHAHGGQFRLSLVGGLIAPHQGFFPEYDSGLYRQGDTVMLVSRGLGNSICPLRFNNRPEILVAILRSTASN